jgi:hypothetical protein
MSIPLSVQSPVRTFAVSIEETRGPTRNPWGRAESREQPAMLLGVACCDVIDEARLRMARRGYRWD